MSIFDNILLAIMALAAIGIVIGMLFPTTPLAEIRAASYVGGREAYMNVACTNNYAIGGEALHMLPACYPTQNVLVGQSLAVGFFAMAIYIYKKEVET